MANSDRLGDAQKFGGPWSLLKLEVVESYLKAFCTALKQQRFDLVYIDAFAGSGSFSYGESDPGGFFPIEPQVHVGSAIRALSTRLNRHSSGPD